jgi:hypothetical protein
LESEDFLEPNVSTKAKSWLNSRAMQENRQDQLPGTLVCIALKESFMRVFLFAVAIMTFLLLSPGLFAAETLLPARIGVAHHYRWHVARIGPQSCFLMPDVVVALNALGPYCSSPRGLYRVAPVRHYGYYWPSGYYVPYYESGLYVPYYGFYRPWGWSDIGRPWGW